MDVSRTRIHALQAERREARRRGSAYLAGALPVLGLLAAGAIGTRASVIAMLCAAAAGLFWLNRAGAATSAERQVVDELILNGWTNVDPDAVARRTRELTSPRVRRAVARAVETLAAPEPTPFAALTRRVRGDALRRRERLGRIAAVLRDPRTPVDPRAVVLAARLVVDESGVPLTASTPARVDERLARVERMLVGR